LPLVTDPVEAKEILQEAREAKVALANICPEHNRGIEAVLEATRRYGEEIGRADLPLILSNTGTYPDYPQLVHMTGVRDVVFGLNIMISALKSFLSDTGPYSAIRVITHLDHGMRDTDKEILENRLDDLAMVMYDCSHDPFDENIKHTAEYVERVKGKALVEGAVDEIAVSGSGEVKNEPTTVEMAKRFMSETGCDLIVANLGSEHRAAETEVCYRGDRAREITAALGRVIVLHGTSSLQKEELSKLKDDGVLKVNVWTRFERVGSRALVQSVLSDLGNILSADEIEELQKEGFLGNRYQQDDYVNDVCYGQVKARMDHMCEQRRREAWVDAAKEEMEGYLDCFGYDRFAK